VRFRASDDAGAGRADVPRAGAFARRRAARARWLSTGWWTKARTGPWAPDVKVTLSLHRTCCSAGQGVLRRSPFCAKYLSKRAKSARRAPAGCACCRRGAGGQGGDRDRAAPQRPPARAPFIAGSNHEEASASDREFAAGAGSPSTSILLGEATISEKAGEQTQASFSNLVAGLAAEINDWPTRCRLSDERPERTLQRVKSRSSSRRSTASSTHDPNRPHAWRFS